MSVGRFPVESGHVLTFARSLGDVAEAYSDESFVANGFADVAAPPTFVQASAQFDPDYPLRPRSGTPWIASSSAEPSPDAQVLHAEQSFEFNRPVRVGDVLTSETRAGETWEKEGRRGGRMVFGQLITEYRDAAGEVVVTATAVTVTTARVPGEAR